MRQNWLWVFGLLGCMGLVTMPLAYATTPSETAKEYRLTADHHLEQGELQSAIQNYQKSIELDPQSPHAYFNLAIGYYQLNDLTAAAKALESLLSLDPQDVEARYNLACIRFYQGQLRDAKIHFEQAKQCCLGKETYLPRIEKGIGLVDELLSLPLPARNQALFVYQLDEGLNPSSIVL